MDAINFIKTINRMCEYYSQCDKPGCPLKSSKLSCNELSGMVNNEEKIISHVEKWSKEHPSKTRQSEFLKLFPFYPEINPNGDGILNIALCSMDKRYQEYKYKSDYNCGYDCPKCCKEYWTKEI